MALPEDTKPHMTDDLVLYNSFLKYKVREMARTWHAHDSQSYQLHYF